MYDTHFCRVNDPSASSVIPSETSKGIGDYLQLRCPSSTNSNFFPAISPPSSSTLGLRYLLNAKDSTNNNDVMDYGQNSERLILDDLEPVPRDRSHTWPRRPVIEPPSLHDSESNPADGIIKEEPEDVESGNDTSCQLSHNLSTGKDNLGVASQPQGPSTSAELGSQNDLSTCKKSTSRKNAWGNLSYADLITKAIQSSPEKKLTLSQIYDWMVQNVNYFRDKGDSTSSAGWKNSIRHNLSLHNRFMRIQNEGAGKSSWWVINPDAKPGKAPRRRGSSMDNSKSIKESRKRAMEKVRMRRNGGKDNPVSPANELTLSPGDYRDRGSSFSSFKSGRQSPDPDLSLDPKLSPWGSENQLYQPYDFMEIGGGGTGETSSKLHEDLGMMRLDLQTNSFLDELESIDPSGTFAEQGMTSSHMYMPSGKPYSSYGTDPGNGYNPPPPPYPAEQGQGTQFKPGTYGKDPMMAGYVANGGGNSAQPGQYSGYSNGVIPSGMQQGQASRMASVGQPRQQQRVIPNSISAALQQGTPVSRSNNQTMSQSLKESAPILTQQLMGCYQAPVSQQAANQNGPQGTMQPQPGMYSNSPQPSADGGMYMTSSNGPMAQPPYYFNDIDLNMDIPELLSCDVDEVIQQELKMDGGQLDFSGFEGYYPQQQQQPPPTAATSSMSNNSNLGTIS